MASMIQKSLNMLGYAFPMYNVEGRYYLMTCAHNSQSWPKTLGCYSRSMFPLSAIPTRMPKAEIWGSVLAVEEKTGVVCYKSDAFMDWIRLRAQMLQDR